MAVLEADVLVVGAGIVGASCAHHLAARGQSVVVAERFASAALGSTGKSNACVRSQWRDSINMQLSWDSIRHYRDFEQIHGTDVGYRPIGYLLLHGPDQWDAQLKAVDLQRSIGIPIEVFDASAAQRFIPFEQDGVAGVTWGPTDGRIDAYMATYAFLDLARRNSAQVLWSSPLTSITHDGSRWHASTEKADVRADVVVNAAGGVVCRSSPTRWVRHSGVPLSADAFLHGIRATR